MQLNAIATPCRIPETNVSQNAGWRATRLQNLHLTWSQFSWWFTSTSRFPVSLGRIRGAKTTVVTADYDRLRSSFSQENDICSESFGILAELKDF